MNNWKKKNNQQQNFHKKKSFQNPKNPKISYKKNISKTKSDLLFENHKDDLGEEYSLNDIIEVGYPIIETSIDIISSGKPSDILQEVHVLLIELVNVGLTSKSSISKFLGVSENDFILDELFTLLENGILSFSEEDGFRVSTKGEVFVEEKKFIPVTTQESFTFFIDGLTKEIFPEAPSAISNTENRLHSAFKMDFDYIEENWMQINHCFTESNGGEKEIVDLANYKRSINYRKDLFQKFFVLFYYPKDQSGKKIQLKVYNNESKLLKKQTETLSNLFSSNRFLFDFSKELEQIEEYKNQFLQTSKEISSEKVSGSYQNLSTFEHKELIKDAFLTAEFAIYIESPWIRKATLEYIPAMEIFLKKNGTKLFIAYGIDLQIRNAPHPETFQLIENLKSKYPNRVYIIDLPNHFKIHFPNLNGSHRKLLIKDYEYYVKGSYNWLSYSGNETENYAVEEGTQFFDNVKEFWHKVFTDYHLDISQLDF